MNNTLLIFVVLLFLLTLLSSFGGSIRESETFYQVPNWNDVTLNSQAGITRGPMQSEIKSSQMMNSIPASYQSIMPSSMPPVDNRTGTASSSLMALSAPSAGIPSSGVSISGNAVSVPSPSQSISANVPSAFDKDTAGSKIASLSSPAMFANPTSPTVSILPSSVSSMPMMPSTVPSPYEGSKSFSSPSLNVEQPMPSARGIETFFNYEKFEDEENSLNMTDQNFSMSDQTYNTNEIIDTSAPPLN